MKKRIGLIPMSAKPFHKGHQLLITNASLENDVVYVLTAKSDRNRRGELPIYWTQMECIWNQVIIPNLPKNVIVNFLQSSPIQEVWKIFDATKHESINTCPVFTIYGDIQDNNARFNNFLLQKYANSLFVVNHVQTRSYDRSLTNNVSGTAMRLYLRTNNKKTFCDNLPFSDAENDFIWKVLTPHLSHPELISL